MNITIKKNLTNPVTIPALVFLICSIAQLGWTQSHPASLHGYTGHSPVNHAPQQAHQGYMSPQPVSPQPIVHRQFSPAPPQAQLTLQVPVQQPAPSLISEIRKRAESLSQIGLKYIFGATSPRQGGMDCSGTMMYLLSDLGFYNIPRTSYHQYEWLKANRTLTHSKSIPARMGAESGLVPGCLIFWGGTYDSGHPVSHVMLYLGQGRDGRHYMFGAKGTKSQGINGSGVDIFELPAGYNENLIGYGMLPGTV